MSALYMCCKSGIIKVTIIVDFGDKECKADALSSIRFTFVLRLIKSLASYQFFQVVILAVWLEISDRTLCIRC